MIKTMVSNKAPDLISKVLNVSSPMITLLLSVVDMEGNYPSLQDRLSIIMLKRKYQVAQSSQGSQFYLLDRIPK
jgi:hypothetical protein